MDNKERKKYYRVYGDGTLTEWLNDEGEQYFLALAYDLADTGHATQTYAGTFPYIYHVTSVAAHVVRYGAEARMVALMHDLIEDTDTTLTDLTRLGFPPAVVEAVGLLTHNPDENYTATYIRRIAEGDTYAHRIAQIVKLADLKMNLAHFPDGKNKPKYHYAQEVIGQARTERLLQGLRS